jgi:hypothetical protein
MEKRAKSGYLYMFLLTLIFVSSCKKDVTSDEELLTGKWNTGTISLNATIGGKTLQEYLISTGTSSVEALMYSTLFNSTLQSYFSGSMQINTDKTFAWTMTGSSIASTGTWSLSADGKELTLSSQDAMSGVFNIVELTETNLKVHLVQTLAQSLTGGLFPDLTVEAELTFTR